MRNLLLPCFDTCSVLALAGYGASRAVTSAGRLAGLLIPDHLDYHEGDEQHYCESEHYVDPMSCDPFDQEHEVSVTPFISGLNGQFLRFLIRTEEHVQHEGEDSQCEYQAYDVHASCEEQT